MRDLLLGLLFLAAWIVLQFGTTITTGWIHVALIAGVILVIRGIALRDEGTAGT